MNEFNVLLNAATNGTPSGSLFDALFARYIAPQESWRELESPLPITILAAGEDLIDYRIYGNTENGESVGERTENLVDKDLTKFENGKRLNVHGNIENSPYHCISDYIPILPGTVYSVFNPNSGNSTYHCFYDSNKDFLMSFSAKGQGLQTATSPANAAYIRCSLLSYSRFPEIFASSMLFEGSTAPTSYIPYGYKLPMVVANGTTTTTTPIYIGSDPLAEDEYVDFGEQKVYRMVNGTLTPTDPPVPIPALPTIQGETIIDYNPSETPVVEPEKMYIKYKPQ